MSENILTKESLFNPPKPEVHKIFVEAPVNAFVYFKRLNAGEQHQYEWSLHRLEGDRLVKDFKGMKFKYLALVLCDAAGNPLIPFEEWHVLEKQDPAFINSLHEHAHEVNKTESVDDLEKNFRNESEEDSLSDSA